MFTLQMIKANAFEKAMGRDPLEFHTLGDFMSPELAMITASDLARSTPAYAGASIVSPLGATWALGQVFEGTLVWAGM